MPLEKEFASYVVNRNFKYLPEFANFSGLSATVGSEVTEVVIGAANRSTANAGEPGAVLDPTTGLPITRMSVAVVSDAIGRFYSGWCEPRRGRHHLPHAPGDARRPGLHHRLRPEARARHEAPREVPLCERGPFVRGLRHAMS